MEELVKGTTQKVGNINVFVPECYTTRTGTNMGDEDDNQIWMQTNPPGFTDYIWIIANHQETDIDLSISMTKEMNGGTEVEQFALGETVWSGLTYWYHDSLCCNVLKGKWGDWAIQVTIIGHEIAEPMVQTVLGSITKNE